MPANANLNVGIEAIADQVNSAVDAFKKTLDANISRSDFTDRVVNHFYDKYGNDFNVAIIHPQHLLTGPEKERIHRHIEKPDGVGTVGYEIYLMKKGHNFDLTRLGDGGFDNWRFKGSYDYESGSTTVKFH
ncbi:hypothetical protein BGW42_005305 [Actinomortierella wolfii]|nr:hypothetical protein BGW42_005305 [Actinomortierella wolfii]